MCLFHLGLDGIKPSDGSIELMAFAYVRASEHSAALELIESLPRITDVGQNVYNQILLNLIRQKKDDKAWKVFNTLRAKILPAPTICMTMINRCAKLELVEKAFLLYRELTAQGMTPNPEVSSALIYAASKRREYYPQAVDLFRQMELLKMPISLPVYNNMLSACAKAADLKTAMSLWQTLFSNNNPQLRPNEYSCTNYIWVLASVEHQSTKISKRAFTYHVAPEEIVASAEQVFNFVQENGLPINNHMLSSLLAVYSNNRCVERAEHLFWTIYPDRGLTRSPFAYELMFKLYDNIKRYEAAQRVHQQLLCDGIRIPYEGWRALARTAAICNRLDEAIAHVKEMVRQGFKPALSDLKLLHLRFFEHQRLDLVEKLNSLCIKNEPAPNPFVPYLERSQRIDKLFKDIYGKKGPKITSQVSDKKTK